MALRVQSACRRAAAVLAGLAMTTAAARAEAPATPAMAGPLVANPDPLDLDAGPLGTMTVGGIASGFALSQDNAGAGDRAGRLDFTNAQLVVQKTEGLVQFYVQAGAYDVLALGTPVVSSRGFTDHSFGYLPQAYLKLAFGDALSVEAGKLPTLIGDEETFSVQNPNVERGLGWNQTNAQTRGVQLNYTAGPVALNLSWNDGYYSDRFTAVSGLATWTIDAANTLAFLGSGNAGRSAAATFATPLLQDNGSLYDLMMTHVEGSWTLQPYIQYSRVPMDPAVGIDGSGTTRTAALLATYNIDAHWNLAGRVEYIATSGDLNLLDGPGSRAWSVTVTPTWQDKIFFVRGEASYVDAGHTTPFETTFGDDGRGSNQFRALLETGVLF